MEKKTRVALDFAGCKLNQAEIEDMARRLVAQGCILVSPDEVADVYIVNTCTVTSTADRKSRQMIRTAKKANPRARTVVTGCYAERSPADLASMAEVDLVISNQDKRDIQRILQRDGFIGSNVPGAWNSGIFRTRAFIGIQDGCNRFCSYCIVPLVRGREKSVPSEQVISEIDARVADGYKEVVLTGTEIGVYRDGGIGLYELVTRVLADTAISRLRLSSLQPGEFSADFLRLWQDGRLCRHFHLSLQSGNDSVLTRMKRGYSAGEYRKAVSLIRDIVPGSAITTDIIAGFPGETEAEFEESYRFCRTLGFARIHVFSFSPRQGTEAAIMPGQVPEHLKKLRSEHMLELARESGRSFRQGHIGEMQEVLWETCSGGVWSGLTGNYIRVYTLSGDDLTNQTTRVKLEKLWRDGMWGTIA